MAIAQVQNQGVFVPTTTVWEIANIHDINVNSEEFKLLLVRLYQNLNQIALAINVKESAYYDTQIFLTGQQFFSTTVNDPTNLRYSFRQVINIGALGAGVTTVAHGLTITTSWTFTRIYGTATDTGGGNYYPLPWASAAGATNIELKVDNTNVVITNNSGVTFTACIVVLEFLQN